MKLSVKDFVAAQTHMIIAVKLPDGAPWAVPVKIHHHEGSNFEWLSKPDTLHSEAIGRSPIVAICLYDKTVDQHAALYMQAGVEQVAMENKDQMKYRALVNNAWLNDESHVKRAISLEEL